jgi:large subunit ribosomal protein L6e
MPKAAATTKKVGAKKRTHKPSVKRTAAEFTTLRPSLTPGTVCILLAGRFRGKRVVMLKQLPHNGPIVVTGPFKINGVPLRRVDPRYVIATRTKVDIASVDVTKVTKEAFARPAAAKREKGEKEFMADKKKQDAEATAKKTGKVSTGKNAGKVSSERLNLQKSVDTAVIAALKKDKEGKAKAGYLRSVFSIVPGDKPHRMIF